MADKEIAEEFLSAAIRVSSYVGASCCDPSLRHGGSVPANLRRHRGGVAPPDKKVAPPVSPRASPHAWRHDAS